MPTISSVTARQILDSRGYPTVEATVTLSDGTIASSSSPSGAIHDEKTEAAQLRDSDSQDFFGRGVTKAVQNINQEIQNALVGQDPLYQTKVDQTLVDLDGTKNKARLGGNAILAVSQAVMKAAAASLRLPLFVYVKEKYQLIEAYRIPTPIFNLINGGKHGGGTLDFQEFQLVPASHLPYSDALQIGVETFMAIEQVLEQKGALRTVGLEGGFSPNLATNSDALDIFSEATKLTRYNLSKDAFLGIDLGPQNFYKNNKYTIKDRTQPMNNREFIKYLKTLHEQYRVFSFEDPLVPKDWDGWKALTAELGETSMIMADDLVQTNKTLLMKAIEEQAANSLIIKPNRTGTVTETIEIASIARNAGWHTVMSHRSSETNDDFLADVAVGIGTDYVKFGAPSRGERVSKYNRLLRIEEILRTSQQAATTTEQTSERDTMSNEPQVAPNSSAAPAVSNSKSTASAAPALNDQTNATPPDQQPTSTQTQTQTQQQNLPQSAVQSSVDETATTSNTTPATPTATAPTVPPAPSPAGKPDITSNNTGVDTPTMHPNPTNPPASQPTAQPPVNPAPQPAPQPAPLPPQPEQPAQQPPQAKPSPVHESATPSAVQPASPRSDSSEQQAHPEPKLTINDTPQNNAPTAASPQPATAVAAQGSTPPEISSNQSVQPSTAPATPPANPPTGLTPTNSPDTVTTSSPANLSPANLSPAQEEDGSEIQANLNELVQSVAATNPAQQTTAKQGESTTPEAATQPSMASGSNLPKPTPPVATAPAQATGDQKPEKELPTTAGLQPPQPPTTE